MWAFLIALLSSPLASSSSASGFDLRAAGRVFGQLDEGVDPPGDAEVAADLGGRGALDVGAAFVRQLLGELAEPDPFRGFLAGGDVAGFAFGLLGLFEGRLE